MGTYEFVKIHYAKDFWRLQTSENINLTWKVYYATKFKKMIQ